MQPTVSMVVPCYNKVKYVEAFFKSVYEQKWDNIELILVNNGSNDGTENIITEWEPKFRKRGYAFIRIDFEKNQGLPGAVKAGMLRATGEYFCTVDCDDELDPEYVSKMAGFLEENPEYEWAACDYVIYTDMESARAYKNTEKKIRLKVQENARFAEAFLFGETGAAQVAGVYMVRMAYMRQCGVLRNFHTHIRGTQEPQYFIPLAVGSGKLKVLRDKLYRYNRYPGQMSEANGYEAVKEYRRKYLLTAEETINSLECPKEEKRRLLFIQKFCALSSVFNGGIKFGSGDDIENSASRLLIFLDESLSPPPMITLRQLIQAGSDILYAAVRGNILNGDMPRYEGTGRLAACGVSGQKGKILLPKLMGTPLEPDFFWDESAGAGAEDCGHTVTKPDFSRLRPGDTVLIFPKAERVINEIKAECQARGVTEFLDYYEMLDILSAHYFPQLYGECVFKPENPDINTFL